MQEKKDVLTKNKKSVGRNALYKWLKDRKMTINDFVNDGKFHYKIVWAWLNGVQKPNLEMAIRIEDLTEGEVTPRAWTQKSSTKPLKGKKNAN
jgi:hypothetical protein